MGCCGRREKGPTDQTQKWDYITLADFRATGVWSSIAYLWLWLLFISTIVVYAVDTFTAVNLLVFNKWSSQVKPYIPFEYSKWIFAGCILFSWALWFFEWIRAIRVIRRGGVAESYMDPLAVSLQSMRSQGWRRFLVFTALTKSKKGMDLLAFFVYFEFKGSFRTILAEGPRQVVNLLTLYAVVQADLVGKSTDQGSSFSAFWSHIQQLYNDNHLQAIILCAMLYTLVIWAISIICLASAAILYIVFLWHYIPSQDGGLANYCRRKIDRRLERIVAVKVKAAIEEEERQKRKAEEKQWKADLKRQKTGDLTGAGPPQMPKLTRQPTLPQLDDLPGGKPDDRLPQTPLIRQDTSATVSTLPPYASRPPTRNEPPHLQRQPTLPPFANERPPTSRSTTQDSGWSNMSYESDAPLLANAGYAGEGGLPSRPPTAFSRQDSSSSFSRPLPRAMSPAPQQSFMPPSRMDTRSTQRPYSPVSRMDSATSRQGFGPRMPVRTNSPFAMDQEPRSPQDPQYNRPPPLRQGSQTPFDRPSTAMSRQPTYGSSQSQPASFSRPLPPAPSPSFSRPYTPPTMVEQPPFAASDSYEMRRNPSHTGPTAPSERGPPSGGYIAFNPGFRSASPAPTARPGPQRSFTATGVEHARQAPLDVPHRSMTASIADNRATIGYSDIVDDYTDRHSHAPLQRAATAGPQDSGWSSRC